MKKILFFSCIAAALLSFVGCEETGNGYEGTNYIYLESEGGKTTLLGTDDDPIIVNVKLTKALSEDLTLDFVVEDPQNALIVADNPVTIKAGGKTASFTIAVSSIEGLSDITNYTVGLDASAQLPEKVVLEAGFSFAVVAIEIPELTPDQLAIVEAYKTATGIDLSKYLGVVNVSTVISGLEIETDEPFVKTVSGKTLITLSETATTEVPVLKMLANPMGVQDHMYSYLRMLTVENPYWFPEDYEPVEDEENPFEIFETLSNAISWNADSDEIFNMSLDNIIFNVDKSIDFVHEYYQPYYEDNVNVVPFAYEFSAYDREKAAIEAETLDDNSYYLCTSNPEYFFNYSGILEDEYGEDMGIFVEPSAEITKDGKLVFRFCYDHSDRVSDYTRVVATYTPNN